MFDAHRDEVAKRFSEVRVLLDHVRALEAPPPSVDPPEVRVLRGLFYVHLYAAVEYTLTGCVERSLSGIQQLSVKTSHFEPCFHAVALDADLKSLSDAGEKGKWKKRLDLWRKSSDENDCAAVDTAIFGPYLQNVSSQRIDTISNCLNISTPMFVHSSHRTYFDELVERRNGVAHGRFSALGLGSARRSPDLMLRFNAISESCLHMIDVFEETLQSRTTIRENFRSLYP